jgi:CheY-like chemotaxis protein
MSDPSVNPILIVDDDQPTQQLLMALMRRNGFKTTVASNGAEAIAALGSSAFSVVILDLMMPSVDGQAVLDFLAREKKTVPVIVCTAAGPKRTNEIKSDLVKAVLRKPFDIDLLNDIVARLAANR